MEIFQKASKEKLRFTVPMGTVTTEDLWDLPLTSVKHISLDSIAISLHEEIENTSKKSFVNTKSTVDAELALKFDIVKSVIETKIAENTAKAEATERKEKKSRLLSLLANKQDEADKELSVEELQKQIEEL